MTDLSTDLSVVVITRDEQARLGRCLASLPPGVEIIVLDSGSTDGTLDVAHKFGAKTAVRPFDNYASQKNAAIAMATRRWCLSIDADEILSPGLAADLARFVASAAGDDVGRDAFRIRRRLHFMGRDMRFGKTSDKPVRLFPVGSGQFQFEIHEQFTPARGRVRGPVFDRQSFIIHHSYDNLTDYFEKFNRYTTRLAERRGRLDFFSFVLHLGRPFVEFISRYILRLGFLDGYPGYCYAILSSLYAFVKYAKAFECQRR